MASRNIQFLILHTTAGNQNNSAKQVQDFFLKPVSQGGRGWSVGGYHWLIERSGMAVRMYADEVITNGVKPYGLIRNANSVHISYIGGLDFAGGKIIGAEDTRTVLQINKQVMLVKGYVEKYPDIKILGHNQIAQKECPCFDVRKFAKGIGIADKNIYKFDNYSIIKSAGDSWYNGSAKLTV